MKPRRKSEDGNGNVFADIGMPNPEEALRQSERRIATKRQLHKLVDQLSESKADAAVRFLQSLCGALPDCGGLVVRTSDRTRNSIERLISASQKLSATYKRQRL